MPFFEQLKVTPAYVRRGFEQDLDQVNRSRFAPEFKELFEYSDTYESIYDAAFIVC